MRSREHYFNDRMMESYSAAFHIKRHRRNLKKLIMVHAELTNQGPNFGDRLQRLGYYWPKMISDTITYARRCHTCQIHGDFIYQVSGQLHPTSSSWSLEMRMDVIRPINPPTSKEHRFILAITDHFSKWAETIPLKEVKTSDVIKFIMHHVIYRFGIPQRIVHDNEP